MGNRIKRTIVVVTALALGFVVQTASASAAPARPMSFDECGTNRDSGVYNCMYISGGGLSATEIRGWSTGFSKAISNYGSGFPAHEQVSAPNGTICNSPTYSITKDSQIISCQLQPGGSFPIAAGTYCAILWAPEGLGGEYVQLAANCGTASA